MTTNKKYKQKKVYKNISFILRVREERGGVRTIATV